LESFSGNIIFCDRFEISYLLSVVFFWDNSVQSISPEWYLRELAIFGSKILG